MKDASDLRIGRFDEPIVGPLAIAPRSNEAGAFEIREMARDLRLTGVEYFDARTDTEFLIAEQVNQAQASRIRERFEERVEPVLHLPSWITILAAAGFASTPRTRKTLTSVNQAEYFTSQSTERRADRRT